MPRGPRIDGITEKQRYLHAARREIAPPDCVPLPPAAIPFFDAVIAELPKADWTAHKVEVAAFLAGIMADLVAAQLALRAEGAVIETAKGPAANPRVGIVSGLASQLLGFRRTLSLNAAGNLRDRGRRIRAGLAMERGPDDDLLAGADDDLDELLN